MADAADLILNGDGPVTFNPQVFHIGFEGSWFSGK